MKLSKGNIGAVYLVDEIHLPPHIERRLEALGMTQKTPITILNAKNNGVLIVKMRGTRFALGRSITENIRVRCAK